MPGETVMDLTQIATNLELGPDQIWFSRNHAPISYPADGNMRSFAIEDSSFWFKHRNDCILETMRLFPPPGAIFDVGGGNGFVSRALNNAGLDVVLLEPGLTGAKNARARGLPLVVCSTLEEAGFKFHSLTAMGLFDVLEHIENDRDFLKVVINLLSPQGRLYLTVPAYNCLWSAEDDCAGHYRRYTLKSLGRTLGAAGFNVEFQTYFFGLLPAPIFLFRTLPGRLRLRTEGNWDRCQAENRLPEGPLARLLQRTLRLEVQRLRSRRTLPFGGSCLVVARPG